MSEPLPAAIRAVLSQGIPIIGAYPSGAAIASRDDFASALYCPAYAKGKQGQLS